ncbi:hypothetical protein HK104_006011, partial [Borealophlyctis nickersoniae]
IYHLLAKRTPFNYALVVCMVIYVISFIPQLMSVRLTMEYGAGLRSSDADRKELDGYVRAYTALYGLGGCIYIVLVQIRFRVIKVVMPYRDIIDWFFIGLTIVVCASTCFLFGVIMPMSPSIQTGASAAWACYGLAVDNILTALFIRVLYKSRKDVDRKMEEKKALFRKVIGSL